MLKTIMAKECGEWFPLFDGEGDAMPAFEHDAAYAHALVQAVEEYRQDRGYILARAAEIMRGFGYE